MAASASGASRRPPPLLQSAPNLVPQLQELAMTTTTQPTATTLVHAARRGERPLTAEDLWTTPRVGAPIPAPDGKSFAVAVTRYDLETNEAKTRIWRVPIEGGEPRALTSE